MASDKKLFLLDGMALIYRAYFAFSSNHRITSKGQNTSAIFGFTNTLLDVLKKEKPTHIAVVFDTAAPTARHEEFAAYKAHREEIPEDLASSIPFVFKICEGFNIPVITKDGYEADDIIGTFAKEAEKQGFETYMMTPDKDFGQLVSDHIFIFKPARAGGGAEVLGVNEVCKRWEIENVDQVKDILGLMGDASDNIPGIPGVGEKTAIQLIKQFGSIEKLLENTSELKGKLKEKVELNKDLAIQSKRLATILLDVPVEFTPEEFKLSEPNREELKELFTELEFRRLADQLNIPIATPANETKAAAVVAAPAYQPSLFDEADNKNSSPAPSPVDVAVEENMPSSFKTIKDVSHKYYLTDTDEKISNLAELLAKQKFFCFDTETTSLDVYTAELVGLSFSIKEHEAYYVPVPPEKEAAQKIVNFFKAVLENPAIGKVAQNLKYDMAILRSYGIDINGKFFDTMIAHFLLQPDMRHGMDVMSEAYLHYSPVSIEELIGKKGKEQKSMRDVDVNIISEYAAEDADVTLQLRNIFDSRLDQGAVRKLFEEVEMPLVKVLAEMESEGINVDQKVLKELSSVLATDITVTEKEIQELAGRTFNVSSPKQVGEILFDVLKITENPTKTKTGQYSTGEDILSKLENKHSIVRRILDYRELVKLKNTYVDVLPSMIHAQTGRIHTSFNQVVAVTGRLSSDNPNLQNIPIRTERGREIRKAFIPRNADYLLLSADYSQIELRIIAELSEDPGMLEAFRSGEDIHASTAAKVYGVALKDVTSDMRRNAKMVNFGIIYGISAFGLADRLNISRTEAKGIIENYFRQYPYIKEYMDLSIQRAREKGYVETILGRRRYLRDINSGNATVRGFAERNAINAPIQGSAADMIKIAMINIQNDLKASSLKSKMLLQVHDELVFDAHVNEVDELKKMVEHRMKTALTLKVPVEVGMGMGKNWLEAH
jgi:DNA polymerase-1